VGLLALGLLLGLTLLELGLRVASGFVGARALSADGARSRTLLALGDSHTYGVFFDAKDADPGRLEDLLEERAPGRYRVVNLGLPGMNSSEVAARLPDWLQRFRPHAVIVCVGVNNIWNRSDAAGGRGAPRWLEGLRVLRLLRLLRVRLGAPAATALPERPDLERVVLGDGHLGVEHRDAETGELLIRHSGSFFRQRDLAESRALLRRDLETMLGHTRAWGSDLVLLTYAEHPVQGTLSPEQRNHVAMNEELRAFAAEHGLTLVDAAARIHALLAEGAPAATYFHPDGSHPNDAGYSAIAPLVADAIEPSLPTGP